MTFTVKLARKLGLNWGKKVLAEVEPLKEWTFAKKGIGSFSDSILVNASAGHRHYRHGEILAKQAAKRSANQPVVTSIPTQQFIDDMIGVKKIDALKAEGIYDRRKCANALAAFKAQGAPSVVKSVPTQQAVDELNAVSLINELKTYEKTGQLSPKMLEKRIDMYEALYGNDGLPVMQDFIAQQRKVLEELKRTYKPISNFDEAATKVTNAIKCELEKISKIYQPSQTDISKSLPKIMKVDKV